MIGHEAVLNTLKDKSAIETLLFLALFGDMLGLPVVPKYYALKFLPFVIPKIETWKRSILRERDWTDRAFD